MFRDVNAHTPAANIIPNRVWMCTIKGALCLQHVMLLHASFRGFIQSQLRKRAIRKTQKMTHKNKTQALITSKYTCLSYSKQVTHTSSTWDRMRPHTINNNWLHSLKDFPRQKCLPYQYCPLLPPLPAVLWYHIWPLCAQGDFQPLKRWAGWEWATDLWAAFL